MLGPYHLSAAAAAAKSLQSCLTLCDPIDGSPPYSSVHGILQARTLEWVAIAFSVPSLQPPRFLTLLFFATSYLTLRLNALFFQNFKLTCFLCPGYLFSYFI